MSASTAAPAPISYSQRHEDLYLLRCFADEPDGFYIDIGAGHPVYDNVSFAFYLKGWRGLTVEPNPWLCELARAIRPRDTVRQILVGAAPGQATFHQVNDFHGFSTMIAANADAARDQFGKDAQPQTMAVTTLADLCEQHAPPAFAFLKVDVEGAEAAVLGGADWQRFRPRLVVVEALAPYTLAPVWDGFEPLLARHGYRPVWFDSLNRYYLAREAEALARHFEPPPPPFAPVPLFRDFKEPLDAGSHPDHRLARLVARAAMIRLPLLEADRMLTLLTAGISEEALQAPADGAAAAAAMRRLFGDQSLVGPIPVLAFRGGETVRDLYRRIIDSDPFRAACGRISASYAW